MIFRNTSISQTARGCHQEQNKTHIVYPLPHFQFRTNQKSQMYSSNQSHKLPHFSLTSTTHPTPLSPMLTASDQSTPEVFFFPPTMKFSHQLPAIYLCQMQITVANFLLYHTLNKQPLLVLIWVVFTYFYNILCSLQTQQ